MPDFLKAAQGITNARRKPPEAPKGWEPGIEWNGRTGRIVTPSTETPDWSALLSAWELDPEAVEVIDETVQMRSWDAAIGDGEVRRMYYYRANIRAKRKGGPDIDELLRAARRRRPPKLAKRRGKGTWALLPADLQAGKAGTPAMVENYQRAVLEQIEHFRALQAVHRFDRLHLDFMGDLVENCSGHYPQQAFTVMLDMREQRRLTRRLALWTVDQMAALGLPLHVTTSGGNHGENRNETGQSYTTFGDNSDIEVVETVAEACRQNPDAYGHVTFSIPDKELSFALDVSGVIVGYAHGHQAKNRKASAQEKVLEWWTGQIKGQRPVGDAQVLITGHWHQPWAATMGPRWSFGCPTADMGSPWFEESYGLATANGLASVVIGDHLRNGWADWWIA